MTHSSSGQIFPLTGVRFLAALMVVAHHFAKPENTLLAHFVRHSFVGVTLFFILSGFILSYTYVAEPGLMKGSNNSFWIARLARIYPVYLIGLVLMAPFIFLWGAGSGLSQITIGSAALLLVQSWLHLVAPLPLWNMWNPPGWSLSAEAFFYIVFPFFCVPLSKLKASYLVGIISACLLMSMAATFIFVVTGSADRTFWMFTPILRLPEFLLGMAVAIIWKNRQTTTFDRIAPYSGPFSLITLVALMCSPAAEEFFYNGAMAPLAMLLICSLACDRGLLAALLSWRPIVLLGGASYSLYILHFPFWSMFSYVAGKLQFLLLVRENFFALYLVLAIFASYVCFRWIEEPANMLLRRRFTRRRVPIARSVQVIDAADPLDYESSTRANI